MTINFERNTQDLIEELDAEAPNFFAVGLVVGFENETKFVFANEPNRLERLNELVRADGECVGLFGVRKEKDEDGRPSLHIFTRPLDEYSTADWALDYLSTLSEVMTETMREKFGLRDETIRFSRGWVN